MKRITNLSLLPLVALLGCGREGPEKVIVEGTVRYQGQPIANGEIRFIPVDGTVGPVSGGPIKDGHYIAEGKGGVPVGQHRVQISGFRASDAPVSSSNIPGLDEGGPREQFLPPQYSSPQSELRTTISADRKRAVRDFDLQ